MIKTILIVFFLLLSIGHADREQEFSKFIEQLSDDRKQAIQLEILEEYFNDPINLMDADVNSLKSIGFNFKEASSIIKLVKANKKITTLKILNKKIKLSNEKFQILNFCTMIKRTKIHIKDKLQIKFRNRYYTKLSKIRGLEENIYKGNGMSSYHRLLANYDNFNFGFTGSKDIGELKYLDSYNFFGEYNSDNSHIIVGDYYLKMGTGSILWNSFSFRKGFNTISPLDQYDNSAYTFKSTLENSSFRGVYGSHIVGLTNKTDIKLQAWISKNYRSGSYTDDSTEFRSIYYQGVYRYDTELQKRDNIDESTFGLAIILENEAFSIGYGLLNLNYSFPINTDSKSSFFGKKGFLQTIHGTYNFNNSKIITEISRDANDNNAIKLGTIYNYDNLESAIYYRNFESGFRSPYGYMFGESSYAANEEGLYAALNFIITDDLKIQNYVDIYKSHTAKTYAVQSMSGLDIMNRIEYIPATKQFISLSFKYEDKSKEYYRYLVDIDGRITKHTIRAEYKINFPKSQSILFRSDYTYSNHSNANDESGILLLSEAKLRLFKSLDARLRFSYFNTESYYSAIWQYDYIIPGKMYNTPMIGQGLRAVFSIRYKISKEFNLRMTLSNLYKYSDQVIGTGYDKVIGNNDTRLYIQLDWNIK